MTIDIDLTTLRTGLNGTVSTPGDPDYDQARTLWNGDIDRHPRLIARCAAADDVAAAVRFGLDSGLELAVRGGAHSFSGASTCDDGLMIDLSRMNSVVVDPAAKTAVCGGGATLADLDAATQEHGLAVPGGTISHTGVAGLTLGGGFGWLTRRHGLTADNLASADVVLADGRRVRASATEHPDLFWAIRGGCGNFGVVTSFEFRLHEVGPMVNTGMFFWSLDGGTDVLRLVRDLAPTLPRDAGMMIAALIAPIRDALQPLFEFVTPMPYVALQGMLDENAPWGMFAYEKALYVKEFADDVIAVITEQVPRKSSPMSIVPMFHLSGAFCDPADDDTAFGGSRTSKYVVNMTALAPDRGLFEADRAWSRAFYEALLPHAGAAATYVNFMNEYDEDRLRVTYGAAKYERLARIKAEYDQGNVFHRTINIRPAGA